MSFKGPTEDKRQESLPRSITTLQDLTQQLREAVKLGAKDRTAALLERLESARLRANREQIEWSRVGGSMAVLEAFADALNATHPAKGAALALVHGAGGTKAPPPGR
jgi:hypothetical protein